MDDVEKKLNDVKKTQKVIAKNLEKNVSKIKNIKKTNIPDIPKTLEELAIQLKNSLVRAYLYKYEIKDKIDKMKKNGMSEDEIAKFEELQTDHQTAIQMRADDIEAQMISIAGSNEKMIELANKLVGKARNLAGKEIDERMKKMVKKAEQKYQEKK